MSFDSVHWYDHDSDTDADTPFSPASKEDLRHPSWKSTLRSWNAPVRRLNYLLFEFWARLVSKFTSSLLSLFLPLYIFPGFL